MYKHFASYLDEWVDHSHIWAGVENLVKVGLSVDQLQLVEFLIILEEEKEVISPSERLPCECSPETDYRSGSGTKDLAKECFSENTQVLS